MLLLLRPVSDGTGQDLPHASGEGSAGERVKNTAFSGKPDQQKDYLSDAAAADSVAALGEGLSLCRVQ